MDELAAQTAEESCQKQSPLGVTSFAISIVSAVIFSVVVIAVKSQTRIFPRNVIFLFSGTVLLINSGIAITALGLGLTGIFYKRYKKLAALGGITISLWVLINTYLFFLTFKDRFSVILSAILR